MGPYGAYYEYHVPVSSDIICIRTYGVVLCRTGCNGGGGGGGHRYHHKPQVTCVGALLRYAMPHVHMENVITHYCTCTVVPTLLDYYEYDH